MPASAIADMWYDRPYWLGPDGDAGAYFALVRALAEEARVGIAHWVMRKKRYHGALRVNGQHLMLVRRAAPEEVVPTTTLEAPAGRAADAREIALAEQLVAALEGPFEPAELEGTYDDRVRELVAAKAAGKVVKLTKTRARRRATSTAGSMASALEASLKAIGGSRGAREDREDEVEELDDEGGIRPFWSGTLTFGLVSVPVELYAAKRAEPGGDAPPERGRAAAAAALRVDEGPGAAGKRSSSCAVGRPTAASS